MRRLPQHCIWIITTLWHLDYWRSNSKHRWHSIDTNFHNGTVQMPQLSLTRKAANTSFLNCWNQLPLPLPKMHSPERLTLHGHSFSEWGNNRVVYSFAKKCYQYCGDGQCWKRLRTVTLDAGPGWHQTIAQVAVPVVNRPGLSISVWFNRQLPTHLNWAGPQREFQWVHL
jgi:hypothetical protein